MFSSVRRNAIGLTASVVKFSSQSPRTWKVLKLNHVAIATPDVGKAANFYRDVLGSAVS